MTSRIIQSEYDRALLIKLIEEQKLPFSISVTKGKNRSIDQNRLQRLWCNEIAEQLGDQTPEQVRGLCKLEIGVPIMRAENEAFAEKYDRLIKPRPYEEKLELMMEPMDFPVTRIMTTNQKWRYLDGIEQKFTQQGLVLTKPVKRENAEQAA